jgi:bacteriocin-like protein
MQNMDQKNSEIRELTDAELEAISGGHMVGDLLRFIARCLKGNGNGDQRRPTN